VTTVHEERIKIRWRDVDAYQHVNNAVYLTYLEECRDAWVHQVMGPSFTFVIVRIAIDYRDELSLDDRDVVVMCAGSGYGTSSIRTVEHVEKLDGSVAAQAESVIVAHDTERRTARPLTQAERATLDAAIRV
jgi:acyl-CoA thioester hydrolase